MTSRPNLHARRNSPASGGTLARLATTRTTSLERTLNQRAYRWLEKLDECADDGGLFSVMRKQYLRLTANERDALLRRWWESPDTQLRLVAALGYGRGTPHEGDPTEEELRATLGQLLENGDDARLRRFAAFALACLRCTRPKSGRPPELDLLYQALSDRGSRVVALQALRTLQGYEASKSFIAPRTFSPWFTQIGQVLQDSEASLAETIAALRLAFDTHAITNATLRARVWQILRESELDPNDLDFLADRAINQELTPLVEFVSDENVPLERRLRVLDRVQTRHSYLRCGWDTWSAVLDHPTIERAPIAAKVLQFLEKRDVIDGFRIVDLARTPDLPTVLRQAIFHALWTKAFKIEHGHSQDGLVLGLLLNMEDAPAIARGAFEHETIPAFNGSASPETTATLLDTLRQASHEDDAFYRGVLALAVSPRAELSADDRRLVLDVLFAMAEASEGDQSQRDAIFRRILQYSLSSTRDLLWDERLPLEYRIGMLPNGVSRQDLFRFVREVPVGPAERSTVSYYLECYLPQNFRYALHGRGADAEQRWNEIRATAAFCEESPEGIVDVVFSSQTSDFVREIARHLLLTHLASHPKDGVAIFQRLVARGRDRTIELGQRRDEFQSTAVTDIPSELTQPLDEFQKNAFRVLAQGSLECLRSPEQITEILAPVLQDTRLLEGLRVLVMTSVPRRFLHDNIEAVWKAAASAESRLVRAALLERLWQEDLFLGCESTVIQTSSKLRTAKSPTEIAIAERAWAEVLPIGRLFSADTLQLVIQVVDSQQTNAVREFARGQLAHRPTKHFDRRRLWFYLTSEEARKIWDDPYVRDAVTRHVTTGVEYFRVRAVIQTGPKHALWPFVASLAVLPDQALVAETFEKLDVSADPQEIVAWRARVAPHVPDAGVLALHRFSLYSDTRDRVARRLNSAFQKAQSRHSDSAELLQAFLSSANKPRGIIDRVAAVLESCSGDPDSIENSPRAILDLLRFAELEARLVARDTRELSNAFVHEPDLSTENISRLLRLETGLTAECIAAKLRARICEKLLPYYPQMSETHLSQILHETMAPAILTGHYLQVHRPGLPLLGEAIIAASEGRESWEQWRFDRPAARKQISHLDEDGVQLWRKNLSTTAGVEVIPDDVLQAATTIRARFQQSVRDQEIPEAYRALIDTSESAPQTIQRYQALVHDLVGPAIGGRAVTVREDAFASLPPSFAEDLRKALATNDRQALLGARYRLDRAVDLLRLLNCDEVALTRNELRAKGELGDARGESAIAQLKQLQVAFQKAPTRQLRQTSETDSHRLDNAFAAARAALDRVKTFAPSTQLVATEVSDFRTLIEIGNRPYGQGSCQNYANNNRFNRALLAYLTDAMTKALVLRTAPTSDNPEGTPLARAILRLGATRKSQKPVIVMEKTYAAGGDGPKYRAFLRQAVKEIARQRGWRAAIPEARGASSMALDDDQVVIIPASLNGVQYEDGADAIVDGDHSTLPTSDYALSVTYSF